MNQRPQSPTSDVYIEQHIPPDRPNPQKRNILINRVKRAPWWLLAIILLLLYIYSEFNQRFLYRSVWASVEQGIETTIYVSTRGYALALVLGLILALMRLSSNTILYQVSTFMVEVVRGIPTLILVYYIALAATPQLVDQLNILGTKMIETEISYDFQAVGDIFGIELRDTFNLDIFGRGTYFSELRTRDIDNRYRVIAALAISYAAFLSEIFRAGIQSIDKGQHEAAQSLGLSRFQTMRLVVLPQAIRVILPPLGNDFIAMLKESSLVSVVGVEDITRRGVTTAQNRFLFFEVYNVVALTYLVLTLSLALLMRLLEAVAADSQRFSLRRLWQWLQGRRKAYVAARMAAQPDPRRDR